LEELFVRVFQVVFVFAAKTKGLENALYLKVDFSTCHACIVKSVLALGAVASLLTNMPVFKGVRDF
jgi:hypothetical protein